MDDFYERYNRQIILDGFGEDAQRKLAVARVLVVGAGGLGCPALLYLSASGIGSIGIIDHDSISLSNLHRQVLYNTDEVGLLKVEVASKKLKATNPGISINVYPFQLDPINAVELISQYDYVLDGSDNFSTRYLVNDVCVLLGKPLVHGSVSGYEGQVAIFNADASPDKPYAARTNYRDLFPTQPGEDEFPNCAEAGVIGVLPGIIGTMQAAELIKLITGIGEGLVNKLLTYNLLRQEIFTVGFQATEVRNYRLPATSAEIAGTDYGDGCKAIPAMVAADKITEIEFSDLDELMKSSTAALIDVREPGETPALRGYQYQQIPLSVFPSFAPDIEGDPVILFCQHGSRSSKAAAMLSEADATRKVYSLKGGVTSQPQGKMFD